MKFTFQMRSQPALRVRYQTEISGIPYFAADGGGAPMYAPPERGGYSHYQVVEMKNSQVTYKVLELGHLYVHARRGSYLLSLFLIHNVSGGHNLQSLWK